MSHAMSGTHPGDVIWRAHGFRTAGDALVEWLAGQHRNDSVTLPILFCYRQYLELALKGILWGTNRGLENPFAPVHDLERLLDEVRKSLAREGYDEESGVDGEFLEDISDVVGEFHRLGDTRGLSLRYPMEFLPEQQIDLGNLKLVMQVIGQELDGLSDMVNADADEIPY